MGLNFILVMVMNAPRYRTEQWGMDTIFLELGNMGLNFLIMVINVPSYVRTVGNKIIKLQTCDYVMVMNALGKLGPTKHHDDINVIKVKPQFNLSS